MSIGPAVILSLLVGGFHTALFMFVRGRGGFQLYTTYVAAALGAWAGIVFVEVLFILGPSADEDLDL